MAFKAKKLLRNWKSACRIKSVTPASLEFLETRTLLSGVTEFAIPTTSSPQGITADASGNLWFTEFNANTIGKLNIVNDQINEYTLPDSGNAGPNQIVRGPDNNLWFTEEFSNKIGEITPSGTITEYALAAGSHPNGITSGPGGLWFTEENAAQIGRITTAGVISLFSDQDASHPTISLPTQITLGADGNLWFLKVGANQDTISRITPAGTVTDFFTGLASNPGAQDITSGPDGKLYVTEANGAFAGIATLDPTTGIITEYQGLTPDSAPMGIVTGPDGNLYFAELSTANIGQINVAGQIQEFSGPTAGSGPSYLAVGGDGNLWLTEANTGRIARVDVTQITALSPSTVSLVAALNPDIDASAITLTATVQGTAGPTPTGNVTFYDGTTSLGTAAVVAGVASMPNVAVDIRTHSLTAQYTGDRVYTGSTSQAFLETVGSLDERYVNQLYLDLFHRDADTGGLNYWTGLLTGRESFQTLAGQMVSSVEYDQNVVTDLFQTLLGRAPDTNGLNYWVSRLQAGANAEVVRASILGTQEYFTHTGGTVTSFLSALYTTFLDRPIDTSGQAYWTPLVNPSDPTTFESVAAQISDSPENRTDVVTSFYTTYMHRSPDSGGLTYWTAQLAAGVSQPTIVAFFVSTPEYLAYNHLDI